MTSGDLSATASSELEQDRKKKQQQLQETALMPLPDHGADGPLDWAHLVDAAKAFEGEDKTVEFSLPSTTVNCALCCGCIIVFWLMFKLNDLCLKRHCCTTHSPHGAWR